MDFDLNRRRQQGRHGVGPTSTEPVDGVTDVVEPESRLRRQDDVDPEVVPGDEGNEAASGTTATHLGRAGHGSIIDGGEGIDEHGLALLCAAENERRLGDVMNPDLRKWRGR